MALPRAAARFALALAEGYTAEGADMQVLILLSIPSDIYPI